MRRDDVPQRRSVGRVRWDRRECYGAVGVVERMGRIGDVEDGVDRATRVTGRRLPDDEDVCRDEREIRAVVVDVRADADEVVVVPELGIVVEQVAARGAPSTPAIGQVAGIRRLGPAEDQHVRAGRDPERRVEPMAALLVPLDLGIADGQAPASAREGAVVGARDQVEVAVIDADLLVDHLDVIVRPDCTGAVGWCDGELAQPGTVEVVEEARERRLRFDERSSRAT